MHIFALSLMVSLVACLVLFGLFAAFTKTPYARRIIEQDERRRRPPVN
jgi:hypothetical protein